MYTFGVETNCPHCDTPFVKVRIPRCGRCESERLRDYYLVNQWKMELPEYKRKWRVPRSRAERVDRQLLLGAVPVGGKIFFWRGEPYLRAEHRESLKSIL